MVKIPIAIKNPIPEDFAKELVYVISEEFKMIGCTVENKLPLLYKIDGCSDLDALTSNGCFYIVNMKKPNPVGLFEEEN